MTASSRTDAEQINRLSKAALEQAERHGTPPSPKIYEVWYAYAEGQNEDLKDGLDQIIKDGSSLSVDSILNARSRFIGEDPMISGVSGVGAKTQGTIEEVVKLIASSIASGKHCEATLTTLAPKLSADLEPEQLQTTVEHIVEATQKNREHIRSLGENLEDTQRELNELRGQLTTLQRESQQDHLTGVGNRRCFDARLSAAIEDARQRGAPLSLVICDLDNFKRFNDQYGHLAGDKLLQKVGSILGSKITDRQTAARIGGEEFALVLPDASTGAAAEFANEIREYIRMIRIVDKKSGTRFRRMTASFGVSTLQPGESMQCFVARADEHLYSAKGRGKDMVVKDGA